MRANPLDFVEQSFNDPPKIASTCQVSWRRQVAAQSAFLYQMVTQQDLTSRKQTFCHREGDSKPSNLEAE
jgi:hypothetical protein